MDEILHQCNADMRTDGAYQFAFDVIRESHGCGEDWTVKFVSPIGEVFEAWKVCGSTEEEVVIKLGALCYNCDETVFADESHACPGFKEGDFLAHEYEVGE